MASMGTVTRLRLPPPHHHKVPSRRRNVELQQRVVCVVLNPLVTTFDSPQPFISSRSKCVTGQQGRLRGNGFAVVWASPSSNSDPSSTKKDAEEKSGGQGPPLLTILAGFLVLLGFCWVVASVGIWLFNLIAFPPPPR